MRKTMGVLSYCKIDDMVISRNMQNHLNEIESKVALGNLLATSVASSQFIQIFSGRMSAGKRLKTIYKHDWEKFGQAMASSHFVTKELVNRIADNARLTSSGKEQNFWKCVYDATRN